MTTDKHRQLALYVAEFGPGTPAERRDLLDALGLIDGTGRGIVPSPDQERQPSLDDLLGPTLTAAISSETSGGRFQDDKVRPRDLSLVPAGLRNYSPPPEPQVKPRRRRGRTVPEVA